MPEKSRGFPRQFTARVDMTAVLAILKGDDLRRVKLLTHGHGQGFEFELVKLDISHSPLARLTYGAHASNAPAEALLAHIESGPQLAVIDIQEGAL